jgi:carbon-monoxide dehydrogenase large subunit
VGETGCAGALTTTYSAVMDALRQVGVAQMNMPFTPGRVWEAIQEAKGV